jgi:hypothetical protein
MFSFRLFRSGPPVTLAPPLRLGLIFFSDGDARAVKAIVNWVASEQLPWRVVDEGPFHALLFERGPRAADPQHVAVLRLSADAERIATRLYGDAMPPMALRKPLQLMHLRIVLEMAASSLIPEYVAHMSPQTQANPAQLSRGVRPYQPREPRDERPPTLA